MPWTPAWLYANPSTERTVVESSDLLMAPIHIPPEPFIDPNWFYSSLAQSAAAIIGLLGAILVSRLIQQFSTINDEKSRVLADYIASRKSLDPTATMMVLYNYKYSLNTEGTGYTVAQISPLIDRSFAEQSLPFEGFPEKFRHLPPDRLPGKFRATIGSELPVSLESINKVKKIDKLVDSILAHLHGLQRLDKLERLGQRVDLLDNDIKDLESATASSNLSNRFQAIRSTVTMVESLRSNLLPQSIVVMIWVLVFISIAGLIVPLAFLNAGPVVWPKAVLLVLFSLGLCGLFAYMFHLVNELKNFGEIEVPRELRM